MNSLLLIDMATSSLSKVIALVTGGASGLGRATAERLVKQGAAGVVILDLPQSNGEVVSKEIGGNCHFSPGDVSFLEF